MASDPSSTRIPTCFVRSSRLPRMIALASASDSATWRRKRMLSCCSAPAKQWRVTRATASSMQVTSLGTVSETMTADPSVPGTGPRRTQRRRGDVIAGLESGERLGGSLGDLEEGIELGELEQGAEVVVQAGQPQLAAELPDLPRDGDERAEAGGVDVAGMGEIEEELPVAGGEGALDEVLELVSVADDELPVVP